MQYPEMYHLSYFAEKIEALLRFTPERDLRGAYIVDKSKRYDLLWLKNEKHRKWYEKTQKHDIFRMSELIDENYKLIRNIFL